MNANPYIVEAMRKRGFPNQAALARHAGIDQTRVGELFWHKVVPVSYQKRDWSEAALAVSAALRVDPEHLWPGEWAYKVQLGDLNEEEIVQGFELSFDDKQELMVAVATLSPKLQKVAVMALGLDGQPAMQQNEIAHYFGVSSTRANHWVQALMRKLTYKLRGKLC